MNKQYLLLFLLIVCINQNSPALDVNTQTHITLQMRDHNGLEIKPFSSLFLPSQPDERDIENHINEMNYRLEQEKPQKQKDAEKSYWKYPDWRTGVNKELKTEETWDKCVNRQILKNLPMSDLLALKYSSLHKNQTVKNYLPKRIDYLKGKYGLKLEAVIDPSSRNNTFINSKDGNEAILLNSNPSDLAFIAKNTLTVAHYRQQLDFEKSNQILANLRKKIEKTLAFLSSISIQSPTTPQSNSNQQKSFSKRQFEQKRRANVSPSKPSTSVTTPTNPNAKDVTVNMKEDPIL